MAYFLGAILGAVPNITAYVIGLHWGWLLLAVGSSMAALIVTPVAGLTATLLYFDARIRSEGLDLQLIAAGLGRGVA
jgi:integral membrane sensor domain MASE1